jgi:hypothetical protein
VSKKSIENELGDLDEWDGAFQVRHRWVEHAEPRRHGHGADRDENAGKRKSGRRHSPSGQRWRSEES